MFSVLTSLAMAASITRAKPPLMAKIIQGCLCHDYSMTSSWPEWDANADTLIYVSLPDGVQAILRRADVGANDSLVWPHSPNAETWIVSLYWVAKCTDFARREHARSSLVIPVSLVP